MSTEIFLSGNEETLKPVITMLIAINQLIHEKDIGQFLGQTLEDNVKASPHTLRMRLIWSSRKEPPYMPAMGMKLQKVEYNIPDVNKKKIDWETIKQVMGGENGYMWGRFIATVKLDNGRQMQCYGATAIEADNQLERMLTLTDAQPLTFGNTELKKEARRKKGEGLYMESVRVYPSYMVLINTKRINIIERKIQLQEDKNKLRSKLRGDYLERGTGRISMYGSKPPDNFKDMKNKALKFEDDDD
jgi:hypothetical protein